MAKLKKNSKENLGGQSEGQNPSLPKFGEQQLGKALEQNSEYGRSFEFSIDGLGKFEALEVSGEKLGTENGFVDKKFFSSDKRKNLKGEMEQKGYRQPKIEQISQFVKKTGGIKGLDEIMGGCLSIPGAWLEVDKKSKCIPFVINNDYFNTFTDGIVVDGFKKSMIFKSIYSGADKWIDTVDYSYKYRDHEKARVLFLKKKEDSIEQSDSKSEVLNEEEAHKLFCKIRDEYIKSLGEDYSFDDLHETRADKIALDAVMQKYGNQNVLDVKFFKDVQQSINEWDDWFSSKGEEIE